MKTKPVPLDILEDPQLGALSYRTRWLLLGLVLRAKKGFVRVPKGQIDRLRSAVFPYETESVEEELRFLEDMGLVKVRAESPYGVDLLWGQKPQPAPVELPFGDDEFTNTWNTMVSRCPGIDRVKALTPARKKAIRAVTIEKNWTLEDWDGYFRHFARSDFLSGRKRETSGPHKHWRPNLDWALNPTNMAKVLEGHYRGHRDASLDRYDALEAYVLGGSQ